MYFHNTPIWGQHLVITPDTVRFVLKIFKKLYTLEYI